MGEWSDAAARLSGLAGAVLGWRPQEFWAATPAELFVILMALRGEAGSDPVAGDDLTRLKELFPDG